jgi:hypothetical protein
MVPPETRGWRVVTKTVRLQKFLIPCFFLINFWVAIEQLKSLFPLGTAGASYSLMGLLAFLAFLLFLTSMEILLLSPVIFLVLFKNEPRDEEGATSTRSERCPGLWS